MKTAPFHSRPSRSRHRSSALLLALLMVSLITIIAVAFLGSMTWELSTARRNYENQRARAFAILGMNTAVAQLREGLDPWDNPYYNFATKPPAFYWSISPGMLTRWSYTSASASSATNIRLFSVSTTTVANSYPIGDGTYAETTNLVNLNAPQSDGTSPIAGATNTTVAGATPPNISVYWVNALKNSANTTASAANPIVGRYAFWIDDENAKINLNTADGTMKYQTTSLGLGSPSEVSLQALQQDGIPLSATIATNIVYLARTAGLNSPKEILRATGTTLDLYTNNVFNMTAYSRSPDLNVFGQPKMALMPILGDSDPDATNMAISSITLQPPKEIYPTPSQLYPYQVVNALNPSYLYFLNGNGYLTWYPPTPPQPTPEPWPLTFRAANGIDQNGNIDGALKSNNTVKTYVLPNYCWINGMMLANYLAGINAAGQAINWPVFPVSGSSTTGFIGKYTPRQIDSIVAQVLSLGQKDISPDYFNNTLSSFDKTTSNRGLRAITTPPLFFGWLSHQWVSGMGRTPKVESIEVKVTTYGAVGAPTDTKNYYPSAALDIWLEWWLPAAYLGGKKVITVGSSSGNISIGQRQNPRGLNAMDLYQDLESHIPGGALPKADNVSTNYWGNQLLANDQGIDFQCNPGLTYPVVDDPDQAMASQYHNPFALETNNITYSGAGPSLGFLTFNTPFAIVSPQDPSTGMASWQDWAPGELRCVRNIFGSSGGYQVNMPMKLNPGHSTLNITGGFQIRGEMEAGTLSDPDPVPLEAIRGTGNPANGSGVAAVLTDDEFWTDPISPGSSTKIRDHFLQSVIQTPFSMDIPAPNDDPSGITKYAFIKVADPLVNKFPGDWTTAGGATVTTNSDTVPLGVPAYWANATPSGAVTNSEYSNSSLFHNSLHDPDSYWLPQADCAVSLLGDIASQTLIPRSARFPNIGYLQYLRTGIIPDDESQPFPSQHGTPFRLLSYAPLTDASNQKTTLATSQPYPDWAMLDLFYFPSILAPYGGPYGYYDTNSPAVWQGYGNSSVLSSFSTGGGSTPGRINPNGAVIYTTNTTIPQSGIARTVPLQAVVHGLMVNQTLVPTTDPYNNPNPGFTGGTPVDDSIAESDANSIPVAIERYIRANGPLRMPGELCNVPEIAALRAGANATRNDLIRQIIGNLTTQSNTFSVWVAGESIMKSKANTDYGVYEPGDQVTAIVRYHFIVERYLDPGADGVYGNAINAGADGVVGSYDDPLDPINHPFLPRYLYRVVSAEEIR